MLLLVFLLPLLVLAAQTQFLGVNYSFDLDFYNDFDGKRCDGKSVWQLVKYDALDVEPPHGDSDKGIQAVRRSCASSFPISFFGGILEVNVYTRAISQRFSINVEVFDEYNTSIAYYMYGRMSKGFSLGWRTILLEINNHAIGYIQFCGRSLHNEIVLIDSFRYIPNNTKSHSFGKVKRSINFASENEAENINREVTKGQDEDEKSGSSGAKDTSPAGEESLKTSEVSGFGRILDRQSESSNGSYKETQVKNYSFWNPITIFLVTLAIVVVAAITMVGSYHCGKIGAMDNSLPPISIEDLEPTSTISIPRVISTYQHN